MHKLDLQNSPLAQILHGDLDFTNNNLEKALANEKDRELFLIWATKHPDIISQSEKLTNVYNKVREINLETWNDPLASQAYAVGKFIVGTAKSAKKLLSPSHSLDEFAQKCRSNSKFPDLSITELNQLADCYVTGFLDFNELKQVLDNNNLLNCPVEKLAKLGEKLPLPLMNQVLQEFLKKGFLYQPSQLVFLLPILNQLTKQDKLAFLLANSFFSPFPPALTFLDSNTVTLVEDIFPELIDCALELTSEDYLKLGKEEYIKRNLLFNQLLEASSIKAPIKQELQEKLDHARLEQRLLLSHVKPDEKEEIKNLYDNSSIPELAQMIETGDWNALFDLLNKSSPYLPIAAFCQKKISIEDLATAMIYYRAYYNHPQSCQIVPFSEENLRKVTNIDESELQSWLKLSRSVPENQQNMILMDAEAFDRYTYDSLPESFFGKYNVPGVFRVLEDGKEKIGLASFALVKSRIPFLAPILHLTPGFEPLATRIQAGHSDLALLLPTEKPRIHGSRDGGLFAPMHDLLHAYARLTRPAPQYEMMTIVRSILQKLKQDRLSPFRKKLDITTPLPYDYFAEKPTHEEFLHYLIVNICGEIIDSSYPMKGEDDVKTNILHHVVKEVWQRSRRSIMEKQWFDPELRSDIIMPKLQEYLGPIIAPVNLSHPEFLMSVRFL